MLVMKWIKMSVNMQSFRLEKKIESTKRNENNFIFDLIWIRENPDVLIDGCLLNDYCMYWIMFEIMMTKKRAVAATKEAAATTYRKRDTTFLIWFVEQKKNSHKLPLHCITSHLKSTECRCFFSRISSIFVFHFLYAFVMWTIRINTNRTTFYFYAKARPKPMLMFIATYSMKFPGESTA